jgi:hypothetical protein
VPEEIHIVPTGKWGHPAYGEMEITPADIAEFVQNFTRGVRLDIPITAGHDNGMSGGELPAIGWFMEVIDRGTDGLTEQFNALVPRANRVGVAWARHHPSAFETRALGARMLARLEAVNRRGASLTVVDSVLPVRRATPGGRVALSAVGDRNVLRPGSRRQSRRPKIASFRVALPFKPLAPPRVAQLAGSCVALRAAFESKMMPSITAIPNKAINPIAADTLKRAGEKEGKDAANHGHGDYRHAEESVGQRGEVFRCASSTVLPRSRPRTLNLIGI